MFDVKICSTLVGVEDKLLVIDFDQLVGVKLEELLAGEEVSHGFAKFALSLQNIGVFPNQATAFFIRELKNVVIGTITCALVANAPPTFALQVV